MRIKVFLSAAMLLSVSVATVSAMAQEINPGLRKDTHISNSLLSVAIGDKIRRNCGSISPRLFRVYTKAKALERYALSKGFTEDEIEAYVKNKTEKHRVKAEADKYLAAKGVVVGNEQSYCALGRKEIENDSLTGQLLKSR